MPRSNANAEGWSCSIEKKKIIAVFVLCSYWSRVNAPHRLPVRDNNDSCTYKLRYNNNNNCIRIPLLSIIVYMFCARDVPSACSILKHNSIQLCARNFMFYKPRSGKNKSSTIFFWNHHWINSHRVEHIWRWRRQIWKFLHRTHYANRTSHLSLLFFVFEKLINFYRFERIQKKFHIRCDRRIWKGAPEMAQENTNVEKSIIELRYRWRMRQWATVATGERQSEANKFINKINLSSIYWRRCASETRQLCKGLRKCVKI